MKCRGEVNAETEARKLAESSRRTALTEQQRRRRPENRVRPDARDKRMDATSTFETRTSKQCVPPPRRTYAICSDECGETKIEMK